MLNHGDHVLGRQDQLAQPRLLVLKVRLYVMLCAWCKSFVRDLVGKGQDIGACIHAAEAPVQPPHRLITHQLHSNVAMRCLRHRLHVPQVPVIYNRDFRVFND